MDDEVIPAINNGGIFIKEYLLMNGPASAWDLWKAWRDFKRSLGRKGPTYQSFWQNYIYPLKTLGLLVEMGEEPAEYTNSKPRKLLDVNHARVDEDAWFDPKSALYGEVHIPKELTRMVPKEAPAKPTSKRIKSTTKKTTGKERATIRKKGEERVRQFIEAYYNQPPEAWAHTPTELVLRKMEVEKELKKARRRKKSGESKGGKNVTTTKRKAKVKSKKPAKTTKTTKSTSGKKGVSKTKTKVKKAPKKRNEGYSKENELWAELSPEERELLSKLRGRG